MSAPAPKDISGVSPNVITYTNGPVLLAQTGSFFAVTLLTVCIRSYSRRFIVNSFGKDDWAMFFALACVVVCFSSHRYQVTLGVGRCVAIVQSDQASYRQILKARQIHMIFVAIGTSAAQISVAFFLLRLAIRRLYSYFLWGIFMFLMCFTIVCTCTLAFQCIPIQVAWDTRLQRPPFGTGSAKCFSGKAFSQIGLFNGVINIATDVLLAVIPILLIWNLRMTVASRISLTVVLGLGIFAAIAGIMRQTSMATTFTNSEPWIHDTYAIWNFIELDIGIIAASLPATKPLLSQLYQTAKSLKKGSKMSGCVSNKTVYIKQTHPTTRTRPHRAEANNELYCCDNLEARSTEGNPQPMFYSACKGQILVTVTKHVEISNVV